MEKQDNYAKFDHSPLRPVRQGITGEQVFAQAWQKLMSTPTQGFETPMLLRVLKTFSYTAQKQDARVLASVITWFGTGQGKLFLDSVAGSTDQERFLKAWGAKNKAVPWINGGRRALESILYGEGDEKMTVRQHEAVECLMSWLGTSPVAASFLGECEQAIQKLGREEYLEFYLSANCHLNKPQVERAMQMARALA